MPIAQNENILPDIQFGSRSSYSTTHQLHRVTDFISSALETKKNSAWEYFLTLRKLSTPFGTMDYSLNSKKYF